MAGVKYNGYQDYRGGGSFSGRLTLGLVAAGVVAKKMLEGVSFNTSITNLGGETNTDKFNEILKTTVDNHDSVGGIVKVTVDGVEVGLGEPYFDSLESQRAFCVFLLRRAK